MFGTFCVIRYTTKKIITFRMANFEQINVNPDKDETVIQENQEKEKSILVSYENTPAAPVAHLLSAATQLELEEETTQE